MIGMFRRSGCVGGKVESNRKKQRIQSHNRCLVIDRIRKNS
jgi:hypothetical protein